MIRTNNKFFLLVTSPPSIRQLWNNYKIIIEVVTWTSSW
jgi:hypothetical protein